MWAPPDRRGAKSAPPDLAPLRWEWTNPWTITDYDYISVPAVGQPPVDVDVASTRPSSPPAEPFVFEIESVDSLSVALTDEPEAALSQVVRPIFVASKKADRKGKRERERDLRRAAEDQSQAKAARRKEKRQKRELKAARKLNSAQPLDQPVPDALSHANLAVNDPPSVVVDTSTPDGLAVVTTTSKRVLSMPEVTTSSTTASSHREDTPQPIQALQDTQPLPSPPRDSPQPSGWFSAADVDAIKSRLMGSKTSGDDAAATAQRLPLRLRNFIPAKKTGSVDHRVVTFMASPTFTQRIASFPVIPAVASCSHRTTVQSPGLGLVLGESSPSCPATQLTAASMEGKPRTRKSKNKKRNKRTVSQTLRDRGSSNSTTRPLPDLNDDTVLAELEDDSSFWPETPNDPAIAVVLPGPSGQAKIGHCPNPRTLIPLRDDDVRGNGEGLLPNIEFISCATPSSSSDSNSTPELTHNSLSSSPHSSEVETPPPSSPLMSSTVTPKPRLFTRVSSDTATYCDRPSNSTIAVSSPPSSPIGYEYVCDLNHPPWLFPWAVLRQLRRLRKGVYYHVQNFNAVRITSGLTDFLGWKMDETFVIALLWDIRRTGTCGSLNAHWEVLLRAVWEVEAIIADAWGRPTPSWDQVAQRIWSDEEYGISDGQWIAGGMAEQLGRVFRWETISS